MQLLNDSPWPSYSVEERDAVASVLLSNKVNFWTGNECKLFEKEFAAFSDSQYAIAVTNGTSALEAAFKALGVGEGDEVILTSRSFMASASAIVFCGAIPVFADIGPDSQNITPESVAKVITPKTKAILAVHLAGWPCDMDGLMMLADQHDLYVVEDCAQAHGAKYKGRSVGSLGHIAAWSFCQDKIMTTGGEGGMVTTNDKALWEKVWSYKDHGKSYDVVHNQEHPPGFRWLHTSFGTNIRMTEMQAAIGRIQLTRMADWTAQRTRNADALRDCLAKYPFISIPEFPAEITHAHYKYYVFVKPDVLPSNWSRDRLMAVISDTGIPCFSGSCSEMYLEEAFASAGLRPANRLPIAQELGETSLMFLIHPTITDDHMSQVVQALDGVLSGVSK